MSILHRVARVFYPYGTHRRVWIGPLSGYKFAVRPTFGVTFVLGIDAYHWKELRSRISSYQVIFDIGANRGQMGLFFHRFAKSADVICCFEPVPMLCRDLRKNLSLNKITNIHVIEKALSAYSGIVSFCFSETHPTQGKLTDVESSYKTPANEVLELESIRLDEFVELTGYLPDFLKIDVEGAAGAVLQGGIETLRKYQPDIFIELHGPEERAAVKRLVYDFGYIAFTLDGHEQDTESNEWANPLWCSQS